MINSRSLAGPSEPHLSQAHEIDRVADAFKARWRSGERPRIEEYLDQVTPALRGALLRELIGVEIEVREAGGELVPLVEFRRRFPNEVEVVEAAFAAMGPSESSTTVGQVGGDSVGDSREGEPQPAESPLSLGRYQIQRVLGQGGFGTVYLAHDPQLDRPVALKVPQRNWFTSAERRAAFVREARLAAQLKHPGVVAVYDVQAEQHGLYIVQEYVDGQNLRRWWSTSSPLTSESCA